eukprot:CAMPEP_0171265004 /NCGR_PEP_ID=MMETSP0790-20130122/57901_1 /TAXON_ID=2925 /ORGANISM="Alexandrium catenella, Strain OF101" /LENGTH=148 /DNA_ID=CAMNT_0011733659 /DNA_START=33 /DNA_END=476 /DNA_ORIENTATION=-
MGSDPQSPVERGRQPTAGKQVRTRKASSCWLEQVWTTSKLVDPTSEDFRGCVTPRRFQGNFTDPRHPHCIRVITVEVHGKSGHIMGANSDRPEGCNGMSDKVWGPLVARFSGGTIIADFSSLDGPSHVLGFWNRKTYSIDWGDGGSWI